MTSNGHNNDESLQSVTMPLRNEIEATGYKEFNNELEANKTAGELLMSIKDDRTVTKKAIASNIESRRYVQKHNSILIEAYRNELRKNDLTPERRYEILNKMEECLRSSERVDEESRLFEKEQLERIHMFPKLVFGLGVASIGIYILCNIARKVA